MHSTIRYSLGAASIALLGCVWMYAQQPMPNTQRDDSTSVLMRAKLASSQRVVEGLMSGDFGMIAKGGSELQRICDSKGWRQHEDPVVVQYRTELHRGAIKLVKLAKEDNLEGAAYTYMHTLTTCINCHEYSRNVLRIAQINRSPVVPIPATERENSEYVRQVYR
jgi:hypothetical protein